jgi:PAS domain S-box-containing protein
MSLRSKITGIATTFILISLTVLLIMNIFNMQAMNMEAVNMENIIYVEKDKLKDDMIYLESVLENDHSIKHLEKGDYIDEGFSSAHHYRELIENMSHNLGIEMAVYIKENNVYRCITSSIIDSDGRSALNIFLDEESAAYTSIESGEDYTGRDIILGNDYLTLYRPLFQPNTNEVIGILFTGVKMDAIKSVISNKSPDMTIHIILLKIGTILLGVSLVVIFIIILNRIIKEKNIAEDHLRVIFDTMPLGANFHDENFEFFDCNEGALKMFGLSSKQEYIENFSKLSPKYQPDWRLSSEKMTEVINKAAIEGYNRFEWMHQKLDGEPVPCEITLVRTVHNKESIITAYMRDLRESKRMMKEIRHRENLLNTVNRVAEILLSINDEKSFKSMLVKSFELIGTCMEVDRVQILRNETKNNELHCVLMYEWLSPYANSSLVNQPIGTVLPYNISPGFKELFLRGEHVNASISIMQERESSFFGAFGVKSIVIIPMFLENNFWGLFSVDDCRQERIFSGDEINILTSTGLMITNAVNKNLQAVRISESNKRVQIMFDAMPLGAFYIDVNLHIMDCNDELLKIFGISSKERFIDRFEDFLPEYQPDGKISKDKVIDAVERAFVEGYLHDEYMHQNLQGEPIPCEVTLVRVKHYDDFVIAAYVRDLRELKAAVTQMNQSRQSFNLLENMLNSLNVMIYVNIPQTGEVLFINDFMKNHFKIKDDYIGKYCYKVFFHDKDEPCDFCPCRKLDNAPLETYVWEMRNPITDRIYRNTSRYMEWSDGRIVHIQHSVDITELIIAKEQAIRANNAKSNFLTKISHEIRTPMNAILGITEIQLQNQKIPNELQEALEKINSSGYLLLSLINNILDMSKIESGKMELSLSNYDFPSLINDTVYLNVILYDNKQIKFTLKVDENIPSRMLGDELRIKQIINNLLSNAFKYTDDGEISMSISAEYQKDPAFVTLVLSISDTGQGMTTEQVDKLYDEFTRFNTDVNSKVEGTGLGMSITKQLVLIMGGEIDVKSEPDKGSVFTVRLPQKIENAEAIGKELAEKLENFRTSDLSQIGKKSQITYEYMPYGRILIVDDVETNLYVARGLMAPYGLSIETAKSGFEMIEKIKNGAVFDIIFLDHFMPKMDGIEAVKIIREMGYTQPVIALTANAIVGQAEVFMQNGFDGFISKPIDIRQINATLNKLVRDKYPPEVVEAAQRQAAAIERPVKNVDPYSDPKLKVIFARDAESSFARIQTILSNSFRRGDDIRQYIIDVHSMKNALNNIGEKQLSAVALKLEMAGRSKDIPVMINETPAFLDALRETIDKIKPKDSDFVEEVFENDLVLLSEKMLAIINACEKYDEAAANSALEELEKRKWSSSIKEHIDDIAMHLLHSDFEKAASVASDYA